MCPNTTRTASFVCYERCKPIVWTQKDFLGSLSSVWALRDSPAGHAAVVRKRVSLATNNDITLPMYARLEQIRRTTKFFSGTDNKLKPERWWYRKGYNKHVQLAPVIDVRDYFHLNRPPFSHSSATCSAPWGFTKLSKFQWGQQSMIIGNKTCQESFRRY